jgi:hypothetical protein
VIIFAKPKGGYECISPFISFLIETHLDKNLIE